MRSTDDFDSTALPVNFDLPAADPACQVSVVVPAFNEAASIAGALAALENQTELTGAKLDPRRYEVLVLANNCTDDTAAQAREFARRRPQMRLHVLEATLPDPHAHVGAARRLVMDEACRRLSAFEASPGVIASTDGDTLVSPRWIAAILREVAAGADAVGGRIRSSREEVAALEDGAQRYYRQDKTYRLLRAAYESVLDPDPFNAWPRHFQYFGASLAVTVEAYRKAGGLPAVPVLEDMAFADRLERIDARIRHSPLVSVMTSLRCVGKVGVGLSSTLSQWTQRARAGEPIHVESGEAIEALALDRQRVRRLTPAGVYQAAAILQVDPGWLRQRRERVSSFGELWQDVSAQQRARRVRHWGFPLVEAPHAIADLRDRLEPWWIILRRPPAQTNRAGRFPPARLPNGGALRDAPGMPHAPRHRSEGNPARAASNARAGAGLPAPTR